MEKEIRRTRAIRLNDEVFIKGKHKSTSNNMTFSSYIEALILKDVSQ